MEHLPERALIVRSPYAGYIVDGWKTWEMRSRPTKIRGRVGIIEAKSGQIIGEATIVNCLVLSLSYLKDKVHKHQVEDFGLLAKWNVAWVLDGAERYKIPVQYKHPKGAVTWVRLND